VLIPDRTEALAYPTGDILLAFCQTCGFIQNIRFDPAQVDYSQETEESQAFSPRFTEFSAELVSDLVRRHNLRGKHVLEVGCGKGDFLTQLVEAGHNTGTGIDPGFLPDRSNSQSADQLDFIRDFYSEQYTHLTGDMVITRHTLEHVPAVRSFVELLRESVSRTPGSTLFIEVPDVRRVLTESAFWDIYYEHCSYFSLGSLARLMHQTGFTVTSVDLGFGDQYILAEGSLGGSPATPIPDDVASLTSEVTLYARQASEAKRRWKSLLQAAHGRGERTVLWGGSSKAVAFLTTLGITEEIEYVVDINPFKQDKFLPGSGQEVIAPEYLTEHRPDHVIVMNPIYEAEIRRDLREMGLSPEVISLS